jgi:hypothetical protein
MRRASAGAALSLLSEFQRAIQARVVEILDRSAVNIRDREMAYRKSGWSSFDPDAPPYTADQVRKERDLHRRNAA